MSVYAQQRRQQAGCCENEGSKRRDNGMISHNECAMVRLWIVAISPGIESLQPQANREVS